MPALEEVTWIIAVTSVAFCASSLGNGANDVSNSYATAIASGTLTFKQAGVLAILTEFAGAVALGGRVTEKIKNGVINVHHFDQHPSALVLAMGCVEFGTSAWLTIATSMGLPVSTTQTVVACLAGVGIASGATLKWGWQGKGLSSIAAAWLISPLFAGVVAALIQSLLNVTVINKNNPYESALRSMPFYIAATCTLFPVFILLELLSKQSIQEFGIARFVIPIVGTFIVILFLAYFFAIPYFRRSLEEDKKDCRLRLIHIPMGPLLLRENPPYYLPNKKECNAHFLSVEAKSSSSSPIEPARVLSYAKYFLLHGVSQDCVTFNSAKVNEAHSHAKIHDVKVERIWMPQLTLAAALMSAAHGSNDVANALGPWVAAYQTWRNGAILEDADSPIWIIVIAALLIGVGFWFFGYKVVRSLGNKITHISPTRSFVINIASSITVLLSSKFGLPVSTTQCQLGATIGVGLCISSTKAVNWKQIGFIIIGWIFTIPVAGLIAGLLMAMGLNTPHQ